MGVESMLGKYTNGDVYDPLNLASKYDNNWLREAELKHGRVCMLAVTGWIANDYGVFKEAFPGVPDVSSLEAHEACVKSGHMWALLAIVGICESLHMSVVVPRLDSDWSGYTPGDYGLDPLKIASDKNKIAELKHGRLAMLGFSGLVTQEALGHAVVMH